MLNELLSLAQSLESAGFELNVRHKAIKEARSGTAFRVMLGPDNDVVDVMPVPADAPLWTLRDGQKNSFPFVQPRLPLMSFPSDLPKSLEALMQKGGKSYRNLMSVYSEAAFQRDRHLGWMPGGYLDSIKRRLIAIQTSCAEEGAVACAAMERFLKACASPESSVDLLEQLRDRILYSLERNPSQDNIDAALAALIGKEKKGVFLNDCALLFDASGYRYPIYHPKVVSAVSKALYECQETPEETSGSVRKCQVSGIESREFITDTFPQPNLPTIGQTYLFSKNKDNPSLARYNVESVESFLVGNDTASRLDAAIRAITDDSRRNKTWRPVAGEKPKQTDLLVAFITSNPGQDLVSVLASPTDQDDELDDDDDPQISRSLRNYQESTRRFLDNVKGRLGEDYDQDMIQIMVIRKLDPANRKVVYSNSMSVDKFYEAAKDWADGEDNTPSWLRIGLPKKGGFSSKRPPHVSPFGLVALSRTTYIRGGTERADIQGLPASETMRLFLAPGNPTRVSPGVLRILSLVLERRGALLSGLAHNLRQGEDGREYDRRGALQTVSILGILLHKLGRKQYMSSHAFKLGQLLAAWDMIHAGYCADLRGGALPPTLLGNQIYSMAQTSPIKALGMLSRRMKPYKAWIRSTSSSFVKMENLRRLTAIKVDKNVSPEVRQQVHNAWSILKALRHAKLAATIADELNESLPGCKIDDLFRAELMLGYTAGLPKAESKIGSESNPEIISIEGDNNE